tara:strand:- start:2504 stop:3487 length:984 start_codon:yes stop_codon:yes gene_type:complete
MASLKVSGLSGVTSTANDSLLYVADTTNSGTSYASKKITVSNFLNGYATETYVTTQINNLVDGAPTALNTLNELAAAINDDSSIASSLTTLINANETHIDNAATLHGIAKDGTSLGTFTGSTISDNVTIKAALQALETAVESASASEADTVKTIQRSTDSTHYLTFVTDDNSSATAESIYTDSGITYNPNSNILTATKISAGTHLDTALLKIGGTDVTSTAAELNILDGVTSTAAELNILDGVTSTATELNILDGVTATTAELNYCDGVTSNIQTQLNAKTTDGDNVNVLVGVTSGETVSDTDYLFLVVQKSTGAIKAIDRTFLETE